MTDAFGMLDWGGEAHTNPAALRMLRRVGGDALVGQMISLFVEDAPGRLRAVRAALAAGDPVAARGALHSLKSSSGQLGASRMYRLCAAGESSAAAGALDVVAPLLADLEAEFALVCDWLEGERGAGEERP